MAGLKRAQVIEILGISIEMLKYWREKLDTEKKRKFYSVRHVLSFYIIKILIKHRGISVRHLAQFDIANLIHWCECFADLESESRILVIDNRSHNFRFESSDYNKPINDYEIDTVPLSRVVLEFNQHLHCLGDTN